MNMMDGNMNKGINAYATAEDLPGEYRSCLTDFKKRIIPA